MKQLLTLLVICQMTNLATSQTSFSASNSYLSASSSGDYTIYSNSATSLSQIDKPFVLVEGYDTKNNNSAINTFGYISSILSNQLGIQLLSQGYDIIVLNFADNGDYIQRNAFLVVELLNRINSAKQGNEQIVVCGLNTGAIVARFALSWMEANSMSHNTRLFASIDAPNKGLNVPPSFQF